IFSERKGSLIYISEAILALFRAKVFGEFPKDLGILLLQGPQIAREYLSQPDETARRFVRAPRWATDFDIDGGDPARFYKTGDLVRYEADGMLHFIGRVDSQAKLNGQRLELAEVEHYVCSLLHGVRVAAEIIEPRGGTPTLAAFIEDPDSSVILSKDDLCSKLHFSLPSFMVPSLFVRVHELPHTSSKKLDRKALKAIGSSQTFQELNALAPASATAQHASMTADVKTPPSTPAERLLQTLWKKVLALPESDIGVDESFFELGGNSIHAIRLATLISAEGCQSIRLPTSAIFQNPRLKDMAMLLESPGLPSSTNGPTIAATTISPELLDYCAKSLAIPPHSIQDIYPCTSLQERMLVASAMSPKAYMADLEWALPLGINVSKLKDAWRQTIDALDILRTQFLSTSSHGTLQVVTKPGAPSAASIVFDNPQSYGGQSLSSLKIVSIDGGVGGKLKLFWRVHHSLFDEWTLLMVQQTVSGFYNNSEVPSPVQFKHFIEHLKNVAVTPFPNPDAKSLDSTGKPHLRIQLSTPLHPAHSMTAGTIARAAWALVLSQYTNSETVLFGATLSGRNAGLTGIESVCGPTLTTVPVRVKIPKGRNISIPTFLQTLQDEAVQMMPHEHHVPDTEDVRKLCDFQNVLSVVQSPSSEDVDPLFQFIDDDSTTSSYHTIPLCIEYSLAGDSSLLQTIFDSDVISTVQMMRILKQIDHVAQQLQQLGPQATVDDIDYLSTSDKQELERWNKIRPEPVREFIDHIMDQEVARRPDGQAVCAHDGDLTYARFDKLAQRLADVLQVEYDIGPGDVIPLCFEKSLWAMVAMFGVLKTGAAFVPTDPAQPAGRLQEIVSQIQPRVMLVSDKTCNYDFATDATLIVLNDHALESTTQYQNTNRTQPRRDPSDLAYIIFTSGSTGKPKGVMITHESYRTGAKPRRKRLARHENIRIIQFSTFSFDTSIEDTLTTWTYGGCVCVPSEWERLNDLEGAMNRMHVTGAHITPSLADALNPANVPTLRHIHFGGEKMTPRALQRWATLDGPVDIRNVYGPTESSISTSCTVRLGPDSNPINIGFPIGCNIWITDANNHDRLMPIGCVGELLIEGHLLAKGYLNNPEKTAEVFITNPAWAESPNSTITRRFYKTGDFACYADDGSIVCLGRKDFQVNLNGYRIETGEVEVILRNLLDERVHDLAVEVVIPNKNNPTATPLLVAFLSMAVSYSGLEDTSSNIEDTPRAKRNLARILREARLPDSLRASIARKTDRGALQKLASHLSAQGLRSFVEEPGNEEDEDYDVDSSSPSLSSSQLTSTSSLPTPPSTTADPILLLQELFATVVGLEREEVNMDHSFIRLGGDSIHALRFVATARRNGFSAMTVVEALHANTLRDLASLYDSDSSGLISSPAQAPIESKNVLHSIAGLDISSSEIEATQPATSFQRLAFEVSLLPLRGYMNTFSFTFNGPVHLHRLEHAIERLIARHGILRTVFVESSDPQVKLLQVILCHRLSNKPRLSIVESDAEFSSTMPPTGYGKPLVRFSLVQGDPTKLILCISHGLYDAVGIDTLCRDLSIAYQGAPFECDPAPQFHSFVASMPPRKESREFWKNLLRGSRMTEITGSTTETGVENSEIKAQMRCPPPPSSSTAKSKSHQYTFATYLKAAWALVLANNSNASSARGKFDIVFGHGVTTRSIVPSESTDYIIGPCLDIVPVRVVSPSTTPDSSSAGALLHSIHSQHLAGLPHHAYGLSDIVRDCTNWLSGANADAQASANCISTVVAHHGLEEAPPTIQLQDEVSAQAVIKPRFFGGWDLWVVSTVLSENQDGSSEVEISMMYCSDTLAEERVDHD
ncbi:PKS/NRPS-like protein biosynthetic cluster, partial [Penicillium ucsense]